MKKNKNKWKYKIDNKMRGAYGETDYDTKTIRINRKAHKKDTAHKKWSKSIPKKDRTLLNTIVHEFMHKDHPKMHEKTVRKETRKKIERLSPAQKKAFYAKFGL